MRSTNSPVRVAVIGGGVTGLTAATELRRAGVEVTVFEGAARPGGVVAAEREDGWLRELGPNSLLEGTTEIAEFIDGLGLGPRRLYASPEAKRRYIVRGGRPVALPASPLGFVTTPLFSARAKLRLLGEPWRPRGRTAGSSRTRTRCSVPIRTRP